MTEVEEHLPFVIGLARRQRHNCWIQTDDLESVAAETLLRVSHRFDPSRGVSFRTWVARRVKGAMLDYMRQWNHLSRTYRCYRAELPFSVVAGADGNFDTEDRRRISSTKELELKDDVAHLLRGTTAREKRVLWWSFGCGLSLKEIALEFGVSESLISQILKRLRVRFGVYDGRFTNKRTAARRQQPSPASPPPSILPDDESTPASTSRSSSRCRASPVWTSSDSIPPPFWARAAARNREIRQRYSRGNVSQRALARDFGISQPLVSRIVNDGRRPRPHTKVRVEDIPEIVKRYSRGDISQRKLACQLGITQSQLWKILNGKRRA